MDIDGDIEGEVAKALYNVSPDIAEIYSPPRATTEAEK